MLTRHEVEKLRREMHGELHASSQAIWVCAVMILLALGLIWAGLAGADASVMPAGIEPPQMYIPG